MSLHLKYHDLGVNMGANNGFLLFFVAPILMVYFYLIVFLGLYLSRRLFSGKLRQTLTAIFLVLAASLFACFSKMKLDLKNAYTDRPPGLSHFIEYCIR